MKAFVTGSTGLLGTNLVHLLLAQGHEVKVLARSAAKAQRIFGDTAAQIVIGDMENVAAFQQELAGCDVLFHGAAYFREYYQPGDHWATLKRINVDATIQILTAAAAQGVQKAIFVGSSGTVGHRPDGQPAAETIPPGPLAGENLYFRSKVLADQKVAEFVQTGTMPVVTILPGWMFGPYDSGPTSSGQIVQDFLAQKLPGIIPGGGSLVDARDVAQGMINAVERGRNGERYLIGGRNITVAEILKILEDVSGVRGPRLPIPYPAALLVATLVETAARLLNRETLMTVNGVRTLRRPHAYDSSKAITELGVSFRPVADTLADEVAWFRRRGRPIVPPPVIATPVAAD